MYTTQYHRQTPGFVPSGQGEGRGKMVTHSDIQFIKCLQKFPHQRTDQVNPSAGLLNVAVFTGMF